MINKGYSRRNFLKQNTLTGLGLMSSVALTGSVLPTDAQASQANGTKKITDLNLRKLR